MKPLIYTNAGDAEQDEAVAVDIGRQRRGRNGGS
jgi:hypothetical protein